MAMPPPLASWSLARQAPARAPRRKSCDIFIKGHRPLSTQITERETRNLADRRVQRPWPLNCRFHGKCYNSLNCPLASQRDATGNEPENTRPMAAGGPVVGTIELGATRFRACRFALAAPA